MPMIDAKHLAEDGKRFQIMKKLAKKMLEQLKALMADDKAVKSLAGSERPGHKYVRRAPKAGGGHTYVYREPVPKSSTSVCTHGSG